MNSESSIFFGWGGNKSVHNCSLILVKSTKENIQWLEDWSNGHGDRLTAESKYGLFCGCFGGVVNTILALAVWKLLSCDVLPWRRYHFVLSAAIMDLMISVFLVLKNVLPMHEAILVAQKVFETLFDSLAILLALNISLNCLFQVIALLKPFMYRMAFTRHRIKMVIGMTWLVAFFYSALGISNSVIDLDTKGYFVMDTLLNVVSMVFWLLTFALCSLSCCVVLYMIVKLKADFKRTMQKFILARGITISIIGVIYCLQLAIMFRNFQNMMVRARYYRNPHLSCEEMRDYVMSWRNITTGLYISMIVRMTFMTRIFCDPFHYLFGTEQVRRLIWIYVTACFCCKKQTPQLDRQFLQQHLSRRSGVPETTLVQYSARHSTVSERKITVERKMTCEMKKTCPM